MANSNAETVTKELSEKPSETPIFDTYETVLPFVKEFVALSKEEATIEEVYNLTVIAIRMGSLERDYLRDFLRRYR